MSSTTLSTNTCKLLLHITCTFKKYATLKSSILSNPKALHIMLYISGTYMKPILHFLISAVPESQSESQNKLYSICKVNGILTCTMWCIL